MEKFMTAALAEAGIPSVLVDRQFGVGGEAYTSYVGPQNFVIGQQDGQQVATPADRDDCGETFRVCNGEVPGAESSHADPGEIDAVPVRRVAFEAVVQQTDQAVVFPGLASGALRRDDDEREIFALVHRFQGTMHRHALEVRAAFAGPVQEQHQRPAFGAFCPVSPGQVLQVGQSAGA